MENIKNISITLLTFGFCYAVGKLFGFSSFTFAWILNFSLMALYTYIAQRLRPGLKSKYFKPLQFEKGGKIYRPAGVLLYKDLLVWIGWEKFKKKRPAIQRDYAVLKEIEYQTRSSELGHTLIFLIVCITALIFTESFWDAKWLLISNLLLNFYPVLLQRYNRPRYNRILEKFRQTARD